MTTLEGQLTRSADQPTTSLRMRKLLRPPQHISENYETWGPTATAFFNEQTVKEESVEECMRDDVQNDEVLDPTWTEGHYSDTPSLDEEVVVTLPQQHSKRGNKVEKVRGRPLASTLAATAHCADELRTPRHSHKSSLTWHFFRQCPDDKLRVTCTLCNQRLKRGKSNQNLGTSCMLKHMQKKHYIQWSAHLKKQDRSEPLPATSAAAFSSSSSQSPGPLSSPQREDVTARPHHALPTISTASHESIQLTIQQSLERKRKYPTTHPQAMILNGTISKFLALEMLPFRMVEATTFKQLMAVAAPQYVVPSRHYFARRSIPALHTHVADQIRCALRNAISGKVHVTTDMWSSKHGQGRYISLTAHWVNLVAAGPEGEGVLAHVLPPPRIGGSCSVEVASCSYSATSSSSHSETYTSNFSTARGKRQQAVLKLLSLGDTTHNAEELWTGIKQQIDEWLVPLNLKPGQVVCDNRQNLVGALSLVGLTHIPCLAHVINLVVQSFLKSYLDMSDLLVKVRSVSAYFRSSHPAAARLLELQRHFGLPAHRLLCDLPTSWNSTLHMLDRLCEQKQAIVEFQTQHAQQNRSVNQHHFTAKEWDSMRDLCTVLQCFEYCTNIVSAEDATISLTIPLVCLLEKTLQTMMDDVVAQKEERPFIPISGLSSTHDSEGGFQYQQRPGTQVSSQGTVLEYDDDEEEQCPQQGGTESNSWASLVRDWGDTEATDITPPKKDSLLPLGSLAHMSEYMLICLRNDCRVAQILTSANYWVSTLLDPRYKDNLPSLLPSLERDNKMHEYKHTLVDALMTAFPPDTGGSVKAQGRGASQQHNWGNSRVNIDSIWKKFMNTPKPSGLPCGISRRQRFHNMVEEYMSTYLHVVTDGSAPFNFWVSKLDTWPELALYALEVLACPAASVMSERVFSTAGGVITDRRICLSSANVGKFTFIKLNRKWIAQNLSLPLDD
ncbi:zinc finger BED domain-containing protein 4-like isoform 1-T2 [Anomaloglossus baeobatrachus]|uniref:zinc finger BED domain-containing protein 4-like isoform X1 n=1 Tax=Anomaloglossus baeobatrachus TaxID=238106 RepID=UPI003F50C207